MIEPPNLDKHHGFVRELTTGCIFGFVRERKKIVPLVKWHDDPIILHLHSEYTGRTKVIDKIGLDVGTKNIVVSFIDSNNKVGHLTEVNGYWPIDKCTPYIRNLLNDKTKKRSDGLARPAKWIEYEGQAILLGRDAEEMAYAQNATLKRPMASGGLTADQESIIILSYVVQGLLYNLSVDLGGLAPKVDLCYCTTAPAVNGDLNMDYHKMVVNMIINNFKTESKLKTYDIVESHAIVLAMSDDDTGIGVSFGAGTVTVSYVRFGVPIFSFCHIGSGDWIDTEVAKRHGWTDWSKHSKETPTTIAAMKHTMSLKEPNFTNRVMMDLFMHYEILVSKVVSSIITGFKENEDKARINGAIPIFIAGGTSSPDGFVEMFTKHMTEQMQGAGMPFQISRIERAPDQLFAVSRGCLRAASLYAE